MYGHIFPDERPLFRSLGLKATWPKLRSLSLEGIYADEQDLLGLIERHKDTLRSLAFTKCSLCTGIWAEVVNEVVFNASMITAFNLDQVNEADAKFRSRTREDRESLRYEGHLVLAKDGERDFVRTSSALSSVGIC
jgi:hypothetical protein